MKLTKNIMVLVVVSSLLHVFAGPADERTRLTNPGGEKGFLKARFGRYDFKSDIRANASAVEQYAESLYILGLGELTTVGYAAYMKMERGVEYYFKGLVDDYFSVKVGSKMVIPPDSKICRVHDGRFLPDSSGWYSIELRASNDYMRGGAGFYDRRHGGQYVGIVWKKAGDDDWRQFKVDDEDLFYTGRLPPALAKTKSKDNGLADITDSAMSNEDHLHIPFAEQDSEEEDTLLFAKLVAVPDTAQVTRTVKVVNELYVEDVKAMNAGRLSSKQFAAKLLGGVSQSADATTQYVLLRNAFNLLLNSGDVANARKLFEVAFCKRGGRFASAMANFSRDTLKKMANAPKHAAAAKPLLALVEEAEESCKACDEAAKELGKRPGDLKAKRSLATNAIRLGDWGFALRTYAEIDDDRGRICRWELMSPDSRTTDYTADQVGDFWWDFVDGKDRRRLLFRSVARHIVYWYRKALAEGKMSELKTVLVKKRLDMLVSVMMMPSCVSHVQTAGIPAGYRRVEYLQSTGKQYVDTGFFVNGRMKIEVDFAFESTSPVQQRVFGSQINRIDDGNALSVTLYINGRGKYAWSCKDGVGQYCSTEVAATQERKRFVVDGSAEMVLLTDVATGSQQYFVDTFSSASHASVTKWPVMIFANKKTSESSGSPMIGEYGRMKLYSFKISEDGSDIRSFIPCVRNEDGCAGLYEKITGQFFMDANGGTFVVGPPTD